MSLALRRLITRATAAGVLSSEQIGVVSHSLRQLDSFSLHDAALLDRIESLVGEADGRSQANVLHALCLSVRDQLDPRVRLSERLQRLLSCVQTELEENVDDLSGPESVMTMEALLLLLPFGGDCLQPRLLEELQGRCLSLAAVAERPVELIGIARIIIQTATTALGEMEGSRAGVEGFAFVRRYHGTHGWSEQALRMLLARIQGRLRSFSKQDMLTLLDTLTVHQPRTGAEPRHDSAEFSAFSSARASVQLYDEARPFVIGHLLPSVQERVQQLSASQHAAWLTRLVRLRLYTQPLFYRLLVGPLREPQMRAAMSASQLATCCFALTQALELEAAEGASSALTPNHRDDCVEALLTMMPALVQRIEGSGQQQQHAVEKEGDEEETETEEGMVLRYAVPLLRCVPERALSEYLARHPPTSADAARTEVLLRGMAEALERCCSLCMRHRASLSHRQLLLVLVFAINWSVYVPRGCAAYVREAREVLCARYRSLPEDACARKQRALFACIRSHVPSFNTIDAVQLFSELVTSVYVLKGSRPPSREEGGEAVTAYLSEADALIADLRRLAQQQILQHNGGGGGGGGADALANVPTPYLTRYLASLSKVGHRAKSDYYSVLLALKDRPLTAFERIAVLGVMARQELKFNALLASTVHDLPQLKESLHARQKAMLLKHLGKLNGHRFVIAPSFDRLEGFLTAKQLEELSFMDAAGCLCGLCDLRQWKSPLLFQVLDRMKTLCGDGGGGPGGARQQCAQLRSCTMKCELLGSLCRMRHTSSEDDEQTEALVCALLADLAQHLPRSRSLFVDLGSLSTMAPVLHFYLANRLRTPAEKGEGRKRERDAWLSFLSVAETLTLGRLRDIAGSRQSRANTFIYKQLSVAVALRWWQTALTGASSHPSDEKTSTLTDDELDKLVDSMDRGRLLMFAHQPVLLMHLLLVGQHIAPRHPNAALDLVSFVFRNSKNVAAPEAVQNLHLADALDGATGTLPSSAHVGNSAHRRQDAPAGFDAAVDAYREVMLMRLPERYRQTTDRVLEGSGKHRGRLSPVEEEMFDLLQSKWRGEGE